MNKELTNEQIELIKNNEWMIFSTSDLENNPRAIIVLASRVEKNRIILCNIQMDKSFDNLKNNPKCFINVYASNENDTQIKLECTAEIYNEGTLYNEIKEYEETNNLPEDLKVRSVIIANINNIEVSEG